jgi:hypothetical protein
MNQKRLINQIELAYAPLTAFEFANLKDDKEIEKIMENASLYLIGQRAVITFENVQPDFNNFILNFEIHQKGNLNILKCELPLIQSFFSTSDDDILEIAFNLLDKSNEQKSIPYNNIHCFSILKRGEDKSDFLKWYSPEKLIQNWYQGKLECNINGDIKSFTKYFVHYVGKATKQSVFKRLTSHNTLLEILSLESQITEKQIPANEVVILTFKFRENLQFLTYGEGSDPKNIVDALLGIGYPDQERVFLDAEKALIKAMEPSYNKVLFKKYPLSKDGLSNENYDSVSYTFIDPIVLIYEEGEIRGGLNYMGGDTILILNNEEFKLIKH